MTKRRVDVEFRAAAQATADAHVTAMDTALSGVTLFGTATEDHYAPVTAEDSEAGYWTARAQLRFDASADADSFYSSMIARTALAGSEVTWHDCTHDDATPVACSHAGRRVWSPFRRFDGVDDRVTLALGAVGFAYGPGTTAAIVRRSSDGSIDGIFQAGSTGTVGWSLQIHSSDLLRCRINGTDRIASTLSLVAADGWAMIAMTKETGTVAPRFHRYLYSTGAWSHENATSTVANSTAPSTSCFIGARGTGTTDSYPGDGAVIGVWNVVLTDSDFENEGLTADLQAWLDLSPRGLWSLGQASAGTAITDLTGNGADESALTGTTVVVESVPFPHLA